MGRFRNLLGSRSWPRGVAFIGRCAFAGGGFLAACGSFTPKPCRPGCVDESTRLDCDHGTARAVKCPFAHEPCVAATCEEGVCGFAPDVDAPCGPDGLALCNEGYACLGPRLKLSALETHTCLLADDGRVWCWGFNPFGELGDGTTVASGNPVPVPLPLPATDVSPGESHTCAVVEDGAAYCWGNNVAGKAAPASTDFNTLVPARISVPGVRFKAINAAHQHTCALTEDARVYCWGDTSGGQCGVDGAANGIGQVPPTLVPDLEGVIGLESGLTHTCALRSSSPNLVCWGSNLSRLGVFDGQLGPAAGDTPYSARPLPVDLGAPVVEIGAGYKSTYAVLADGTAYAWGANDRGQLGTGASGAAVITPRPVLAADDPPRPLSGVKEVLRSDGSDECARIEDSSLPSRYVCWGTADHGELGLGSAGGQVVALATPTTVLPPSASKMARGVNHACVVVDEGAVEIWCYGLSGLVGNGRTDHVANQLVPAPVVWDPRNFEKILRDASR